MQDSNEILVATLYKFFKVDDLVALQDQLYEICNKNNVMGTILIANEGVNGTISAKPREIEKTLISIQKDDRFSEIEIKYSSTNKQPFHKMRVRLKKEIVTIGLPEINPNKTVGTYVKPEEWNDIISDPDIILIDTRNKFEIKIGSFKNALDPRTTSFRDFPEWVKKFKQDKTNTNKKIAMYCTGGIRCEKASSLMKEEGFNEVYHLQGGILKYLEQVEKEKSLWEGECFVFDDRVCLTENLEVGSYKMCFACRMPITEDELNDDRYEEGISCLYCYDKTTKDKKERFESRQKQIELSKLRGEKHIGGQQKK
ncbi:rhodanese-related sulfurtransferase [Hyphomicrobiales bacterium]|nr:rhodanese-related sulfurtransferase [Hyphomicrobiales bacterium]MDA9034222.1 rhodanese-related sulfurtransferase [Hyphomicrobiales bacterium]